MFSHKVNLGNVPLLPGRVTAGQQAGLRAIGLYVKGVAARYPKVRRLKVDTTKWTIKQRRFFFAALKRGEIDVPYRRGASPGSQRAGQRWTVDDDKVAQGTVIVGNNAGYAPLLYSKARQSWYHRGNWQHLEQIGKAVGPTSRRLMREHVANKVEGK